MRLNRSHALSRYVDRAQRALDFERHAFFRSRPLRPDVVLYESFAGNGVLCNPEAIFRYLLQHPDFTRLEHVWSISDPAAIRRFRSEFGGDPRVRFVRRGSSAYWRELATAGYLINNATFAPEFGKRPGQVYLNTWHGTPLKLMGFDMPDGAYESANTLRNFLAADYLLAANPFMSEAMYESAYRLRNIYPGRIIEAGYPRIDRQFLGADAADEARRELVDAGMQIGDRRIVLFAPTWRGSSFSNPEDDLDGLAVQVAELQSSVGGDFVVLLKTHQVVHARAAARPALTRILVPNTIPTNVLLGIADGLVTDYSSVFFDFLATGRPVAFLTPDADAYQGVRGTYLPLDELPGPVTPDPREAGMQLRAAMDSAVPHARYHEWASRFVPFDDGGATARVVDIVFRGDDRDRRGRAALRDGRRRVLFYLGGMRSNGITTSGLNLLSAIDHDRYDVTALMPLLRSEAARANQALIHPAVRQVFRIGGMNGSKALHLRRRLDGLVGSPLEPGIAGWHESLWVDEWARVFGSAQFDWAADFSGYSPFWANLMLHAPGVPHAIWLHNEMVADRERTVGGRKRFRRALGQVFSLYGSFGSLVSVSPRLTELNRDELGGYAPEERFVTVRNLPNVDRVIDGVREPLADLLTPDEATPPWLVLLGRRHPGHRWFVSVGRLSPEKNHARLIRAFARVHAHDPDVRLIIVGGGPLEDDLRSQIRGAGLEHAVFLAGERRNPFAIMAAADCFVLSSEYEGQPMVLLEAALCGMPIVSTSFASVDDALPAATIHIVDQDDDALSEGMLAFLRGDVPASTLDISDYMREVAGELDTLIDGSIAAGAR
ncbi:glycosyltransferase [Microbacterium deminutum]|uniref:Glycosyl transferase family 1 domain-containing protein n=1 Tax=Microbacterium deminutum TaxID=344164 RepID=A0ABP5CBM8_9MICO